MVPSFDKASSPRAQLAASLTEAEARPLLLARLVRDFSMAGIPDHSDSAVLDMVAKRTFKVDSSSFSLHRYFHFQHDTITNFVDLPGRNARVES